MKSKMRKKLIAFMLCMVLVICNSVSILADAPAAATTTTEKQVKETGTAKSEGASEEEQSADDEKDTSEQSDEESAPETETTEKKEETTEATTEDKEDATTATTTKAKEETTEATETSDKDETTGAEDDSDKKDKTSETSEEETDKEKTTEAKDETAPSELTYTNDDVVITVSEVAEGAIPEGAELKVVPILKDDADTQTQYAEVEQKIQEKAAETETEIKGFLAYDITFVDEDGNEIEPNSEVKVSIEYKQAAIPAELSEEDAKNTEVSVMHLEEDADGNVSQVVDMGEAGKIDALETTDTKQVEKVEVKTESFSYYTIYWIADNNIRDSVDVHYVDTAGNSLDGSVKLDQDKTPSYEWNVDEPITLKESEYEADISGYTYQYATVASDFRSADDDPIIYRLKLEKEGYGFGTSYYIQYSEQEEGNSWKKIEEGQEVYMVYELDSTGGGDGGSGATGDLAHRKYVTDKNDGTYDLTLDVTGAIGTETNPAKVDVVLALDLSGSMDDYNYSTNQSNIEDAKGAINTLITSLSENKTVESRWKLVTFESNAKIVNNQWESASAMKTRISQYDSGDCDGGTNYEAALTQAGAALGTPDEDRIKIVVFLTDGQPTYHGQQTQGGGDYTTQKDYDGAVNGAKKVNCDRFYAIGMNLPPDVGYSEYYGQHLGIYKSGLEVLQSVADNISGNPTTQVENVTNADLVKIFEGIAGNVTTYTATNVSITDTLTAEVDQVKDSQPTVRVLNADNEDVTATEVAAGKIVPTYDPETRKLRLDFDDNYELKKNYTYSVTIKIKPNDAAKNKYVENNYTYTDVGEEGTGLTSEGKGGFFSNVENSAKVMWTTNGENKEGLYNRPVVQLPETETPTPPPTTDKELSREKYVKDNKDGTYDLTLNVSGQVGSITNKAKVDVLLLIDVSTSMRYGLDGTKYDSVRDDSRITEAKKAVKELTDELAEKSDTVDSRWKVVTFGERATNLTPSWTTANDAYDKVNNISIHYNVGTNYEAGFAKTVDALNQDKRAGAKQIVIFLTDGAPTFAGENANIGEGSYTSQEILDATNNAAKEIACNQFYAIGIGIGDVYVYNGGGSYWSDGTKILTDIAKNVSSTTPGTVKNTTEIVEVFRQIAASITSFLCSNVIITDTLSDYAEIADENAELKITVKRNAGTDKEEFVGTSQGGTVKDRATLNLPKSETNEAATLTASYDENLRQIVLDFPDEYKLEGDLTYYVTVKIAPTIEAYEGYSKEKIYPDTGEAGTDAPDNIPNTSSGQLGFHCNEEATVTYTYNGTEQTSKYPMPVIQVEPSSEEDTPYIEVEKKFTGDIENPETELPDFQIEVYSDSSCTEEYLVDILSLNDSDVQHTGNTYVWRLDNLEAGTYYLKESGETVEITVDGENIQKYTVTTTVNNEAVTDWPVTVETQEPTFQTVGELKRETSCNNKSFEFLGDYNFIAASLKTSRKYFIWTQKELSSGEREAIRTFVSTSQGNWSQIDDPEATVYFYSGMDNLTKGITINGGTVKVSEADGSGKRTLSFESGSNQWAQLVYGQYEVTSAIDAEIAIENNYTENGLDVDIEKNGTTYDVKLDGAKFKLYQHNGTDWEVVKEYTISDEVELPKLNAGIYKLEETQAPAEFSLLDENIIFKVEPQAVTLLDEETMEPLSNNEATMYRVTKTENGWKIQVKNNCIYDLPSAGGPGIYWYTLSGTLLMAGAVLIVYREKRKREVLLRK